MVPQKMRPGCPGTTVLAPFLCLGWVGDNDCSSYNKTISHALRALRSRLSRPEMNKSRTSVDRWSTTNVHQT